MLLILIAYKPAARESGNVPIVQKIQLFDPLGCLLLLGLLLCLLLALQFAIQFRTWNCREVVGLLIGFCALGVLLATQQWHTDENTAILPRSIIGRKGVLVGCGLGFFVNMGVNCHVYYLPLFFQVCFLKPPSPPLHILDRQS